MKKRITSANQTQKKHFINFSYEQLNNSITTHANSCKYFFHEVPLTPELKEIQKRLKKDC